MDVLGFEKLIFHYDKIEKIRRGEPQFPVHATLSLGNYCNHRCLWCTAYEYQKDKALIVDHARLVDWLGRAAIRGLKAVGYVGNGEPTAHPKFGGLVGAVKDLGLQQGMFTNGYLLDRFEKEILEGFTYIRISLDAGTAETHAHVHDVPPGHFPRIIDNLRSIIGKRKNRAPTVGIQFATHHHNIGDLSAAAKLSAEIGADYFSVKPVFNRGSVGERIEKNTLTFDDLNPAVEAIRREFETPDFNIHHRPHQILSEAADRNILEYDRCFAGFFNVNVYEDGKIVYCGPHRIAVGTMDDDMELIERRSFELCGKLDLSKCPGGCRYHALNHLLDTVLHPERAQEFHINFL